ncbi:hypothetical protein [uncultured Paraglaciecola sp.]|uniref:hypothetical protein n=1 Tax=uncultured Paraglaciecola sp. TaxID=1765024 RepID=UPI00261340DE|nr:hypothetical protein [uncultured Paraglaciecola sp.]
MKANSTKYLLCCVFFVSYFLHTSVNAQDKPKHLTFSYIDHPVIIKDIIPIIERTYLELGIPIDLMMFPTHRNLMAVESEEVDGDVGFSELGLRGYDTLIKIEPSMVTASFVLLCLPDVVCSEEVLFDDTNAIVTTDTLLKSLNTFYSKPLSDAFYKINNLSVIANLILGKRFQYGVYVAGENQDLGAEMQHLKVIELFKAQTFHTVHKKYAFMKNEISAALKRSLKIAQVQHN